MQLRGNAGALLDGFLLLVSVMVLTACGGGGGSASSPANTQPTAVPPPVTLEAPSSTAADLALADRLYKGDARTPAGFDLETRPTNVTGVISTRHLKNTDLAAGAQAMSTTYEVCTNDMAQAMDWSERQATWQGQYSDLVEVRSDARLFEVVRVPRADVSALIRHRVFRCDYLDRAGSDLRSDSGAAGFMNQRPLNAGELEKLAEYLWQFTLFNNSDYAVQSSISSTNGNSIVHTIRMGQLIRGASGECDSVQVSDWIHTLNTIDGSLTRELRPVRSFAVKSAAAEVLSCTS